MSTYGQFEADGSFCDSGQVILFNARSKDPSDPKKYIVRIFKNTRGDSHQLSCFLSNSRAQAILTREKQAKHWASIVHVDSAGCQGYSVQPRYESNLEEFIRRSKFSLTDAILRRFVKGIIAGLKEAEELGPHGNLKPTNVLLEAPGKWAEAIVKLTDAHFHQSTDIHPGNDLRALARIIYFLVTGKEPALSLHRVSSEEIWSLQGGAASGWKDFCNQLLADAGTLTLTEAEELLDQVPTVSKRADLAKLVSFVLLCCCLLGLGFWAIYKWREGPTMEAVPEDSIVQWQTLVSDYDSWLQAVDSSMEQAEEGADEMQFWVADAYLNQTVLQWYQQALDDGILIDPWLIIDKKVNPQDIRTTIPGVLKKVRYLERLEKSHFFVEELRRKIKGWPAPARLQTISEAFEALGLNQPAAEIKRIAEQFDRNTDTNLIHQLGLIHETELHAKMLNDSCRQLLAKSTALSKQGHASDPLPEDRVLAGLVDYAKSSLAAANNMEALDDTIQQLYRQIESIEDLVDSQVYREQIDLKLFREQSEINQANAVLSAKIIETWLDEVPQYARLSDSENPLLTEFWEEEAMKVRAVTTELVNIKNQLGLEGEDLERVLAALDTIEKEQEAIFKRQDQIRQKPAIVKLSQELNSLNAQILNQWDRLLQKAQQSLSDIHPDFDEWEAKILADTIPNDEILNREWVRRRDAILEATPRVQLESDLRVFGRLRRELRQVRHFLSSLSGEQMLSASTISSQGIDGPVYEALELFLEELREEVFDGIFQRLTPGVIEEMDPAQFIAASEQQAALEHYEKLKTDVVLFGQDVQRVRSALALGESYGKFPESFWLTWRNHEVLKSLRSHPAIEPLINQLEALEQLYENPPTEPTTLLALVTDRDTQLANAILAWKQLEKIDNWPRTADEFERDVSALRTLLDREDMTSRKGLIEEGRQRWLARAEQLTSKQELETAFRFLPEYRVKPSQLRPLMHFRYFIFSELSALGRRPDASRAGGNMVAQWKSELLTQIKGNKRWDELNEVKILIEQLEAFQPDKEAEPLPSSQLGPGLKSWEVVRGETSDEEIAYRWNCPLSERSHKIDFIKIEMPDLNLCYMSRTEISMGLFRDWIEQESDWEKWRNLISEMDIINGFEMRAGPRVWEVVGRSIKVPKDGWIYPLPGWPDVLYFSDYKDGLPTEDHPMQYISPEFARKFALSLNCILPTPAQWKRAHRDHLDLNPNRRDQSWINQQTYVATNFNDYHAWPDMDSFGPMIDPSILTGIAATPVKDAADDGKVWFSGVDDGASGSQFSHLTGNVAEYLYEEGRFYVGGASALSAPSIEPSGVYPLDGLIPDNGFSDVGIRLAFVVEGKLPGREFVNLLKDYYSQWILKN